MLIFLFESAVHISIGYCNSMSLNHKLEWFILAMKQTKLVDKNMYTDIKSEE